MTKETHPEQIPSGFPKKGIVRKRQSGDPKKALAVLCLASFLVPFMGASLNLSLPQISNAFSMNAVTLTWISTAYLISSAVFQVPFAKVGDRVGRKKIFLGGVFVFSFFTLLSCIAHTSGGLILFRCMAGIGSAMMFGTSMALLTALFPKGKRGAAFGIHTAFVYAALAAGPLLGGWMTQYWGWRSIFYVSAAIGFGVFVLSSLFLKDEGVEAKGEKFDTYGVIAYAAGLFSLIYGFANLPDWNGLLWILAGTVLLTAFVRIEGHCPYPVFNVRLFSQNRVFALSSVAALIHYAATAAIAFMLSLYLQYVRGFEAGTAGLVLIAQAVFQSLFTLWAGWRSDRVSPSRLATGGMSILSLGLLGLVFLTPTTPLWILVALLMLLGAGFGMFSSPNTHVIMSSVDPKYYGQASATTGTVRLTGQAFSMGVAGMTLSLRMGDSKMIPELYPQFMQSLKMTCIVFFGLCLIGVYASSARSNPTH